MISPPGWFGKLSSLGDFASRRLPPHWVQACDPWLSACIAASQHELGGQWLQAYLAAPLWRFAWAPQVVDGSWWFGVLMPSCDKVGRYFPLVVAQPRAAPPSERFALEHLDLWWEQTAQCALQTLAEGQDLAQFEAALEELPPWPAARAPAPPVMQVQGQSLIMQPGASLAELAQALAGAELQQRLVGQSVWWPWRPAVAYAQGLIVPGLPAPGSFARMLTMPT